MADNAFDPATTVVSDIKGDYTLDPTHSRLGFSTRHAMVTTVRGQFTDFTGEAVVDTADPAASKVEVTIQAASIDTGVADRDAHLRSADFFDVETYPELTFRSTGIRPDGDDFLLDGELTIRGTTRPVTFELEYNGAAANPLANGAPAAGFSAETEISRKDFGLEWNVALEAGGVLVGDKVKIALEIEAGKTA